MTGDGAPPEQSVFERIMANARPYLGVRDNLRHTEICLDFCRLLLCNEPGDNWIVYPAMILHDVGWSQVPQDVLLKAFGPRGTFDRRLNRIHEVEGARIAVAILQQVGYPEEWVPEIVDIVENHDSRLVAVSDSDKIVKDADKLCRFTRFGFFLDCRRFQWSPEEWYYGIQNESKAWFFTDKALQLAMETLEETMRLGPEVE